MVTQNPIDSSEGRKKRGLFSVPPMTYVVFVPRDENTGFVTGGSLRSECALSKAHTLPWTESTLEQVLVLSRLRTEGELTETAGNQWVRDSHAFQRLEPFHATVCTQPSDQSARNPRLMHCLGLNQLRISSSSCLGCAPRAK